MSFRLLPGPLSAAPGQCGGRGADRSAASHHAPSSPRLHLQPHRPPRHAGFIKSVQGEVHVLSAGGDTRLAKPGDRVSPIDRISTGPASAASSGAACRARHWSSALIRRLDLKQFHFDSTTQDGGLLVSLLRGSLRMVSGLIALSQPWTRCACRSPPSASAARTVTADAQP